MLVGCEEMTLAVDQPTVISRCIQQGHAEVGRREHIVQYMQFRGCPSTIDMIQCGFSDLI